MSKKEQKTELARLSASRIKTLGECSFYYYARYHIKLPDKGNDGSKRGTVSHDLFELLTKKKYLPLAKQLHDSGCDISAFPVIARFLRIKCFKNELEMLAEDKASKKTNIGLIYEMIKVGLGAGFFPEDNEEIIDSEFAFDITDEKLKFRMVGFIDKIIFNKDTKEVLISDYKSSKVQFKGEDLETNIQAMMYVLAAHYLKKDGKLPNFKKALARFIFLRFAENPYQNLEFTDEQIEGFKHYLSYLNDIVANFTEKDSASDYASKDPKRRWKCSTKSGWKCAFKDPFEYYALIDDKNTLIKTVFEQDYLQKEQYLPLSGGQKWEKRQYNGCPAHDFRIHNENEDHFNF